MPYPFFVFCWKNTNIYVKGNIMTKKKQFVILAIFVVLAIISCVSALVVVLTASNQASTSKVNVDYTASDVYVKIKANYYIGSNMVAMVNGDSTEVVLSPINHNGSLNQPNAKTTSALMDVDSGGKVVFEYIFENLSGTVPAKISQMTNADGTPYVPTDTYNNVNVQYVGTSKVMGASAYGGKDTISDIAILPLSTKYIYVIVSVKDLMHDVQYKGSFGWMLSRADLVDNTTENVSGGTIISGTDGTDVVNKDEMDKINLVLDCENEKPNYYPQKANKCFTGWYTKDESGNVIEVEWPAMITSTTNIYPKYENETKGLSYTYTGDGYAIVGGYNGSTSNIFVPDVHNDGTHGNAKITSIADYAFQNNSKITNLTIPNTITKIGSYAFEHCPKLKSIFIPKSVLSIGTRAFSEDYEVNMVVVDVDNPVYDSRDNCNAINVTGSNTLIFGYKDTVIPNSITTIGTYAFYDVRNRENLDIPYGVKTLEKNSFFWSKIASISIPSSVESIGNHAMYGCEYLVNIIIPASVTSIGQYVLSYCTKLEKISVEKSNPIYNSNNNCNAIIETSTNTLLYGCQNTVIPDSVTKLSEYAFSHCKNITEIKISKNIISLSNRTFSGCNKVLTIAVDPDNPVYDSRDNCNAIVETSSNTLLVGCSNTIIPNSVSIIADYAFAGLTNLTSINIPASVKKLSYTSFFECVNIDTIVVDPNNTVYDSRNNCNAIIETTSNTLVRGCKSSTIPSTVTEIGDRSFYYVQELNTITIPNSVKKIGSSAFNTCYDLATISIPTSVTYIGSKVFEGCDALTSITISSGVSYIGNNAFAGCTNLDSITFADPTGWKLYDSETSTIGEEVTISTTDLYYNSTLLKAVYSGKVWKKG